MKNKYEDGDDVEMGIKVTKQSQSGLFSNDRLLTIKAGIVSYFSSVPKNFKGNYRTVQLSGQVPKFTIPANQISKVQLKGKQLTLLVLKSKLIAKEQFDKMVKGTKQIPQDPIKATKSDTGGYEQWVFKCQDQQSLLQFYYLINLFRSGNPKFQPHLAEIVSGFQQKKYPRKKTIDPSLVNNKILRPDDPRRQSQVPKSDRSIFQQLIKAEQKKSILNLPPPEPPVEQPEIEIQQQHNQQQEVALQKQRITHVVQKINFINLPILDIIEEKPGQDKVSQMSRVPQKIKPTQIQVINTFEEKQQPLLEKSKIYEPKLPELQELNQQHQQNIIIEQIREKIIERVPQKQQIPEKVLEKQVTKIVEIKKQEKIPFTEQFPSNFDSRIQFEVKQHKQKKINQMLRATLANKKSDYKTIANTFGITVEELTEFIKVNNPQDDEYWDFIQNQLGQLLASRSNNTKQATNEGIIPINENIISEYHNLGQGNVNTAVQESQLMEGQLSFESYQNETQSENQIFNWMKNQMSQKAPIPFTTKILNKFQYKISIRQLKYDINQIISVKGCWIVNKNGYLQQFLAYLYLKKMIKQIKLKQKGNLAIECGQPFYIKFKDYQAIAKQLRVGYSYYPLKSIRALQYITKSKDMKLFEKCFPQFNLNVQIDKDQQCYRLQLQRKGQDFQILAIENQLQKLIFPIDNQLKLFYETSQFQNIQKNCLLLLKEIQNSKQKITQKSLTDILESINSNLQVDIICKLLGARIDKSTNLFFHPTVLKLGNRQFGQQVSLIRKARKRGNYELSRTITQKVMSRLQFYKHVTPTSNFIQIYLQLIDLMIIEKGQLHRAVPVLLRVLNFLSQYQIEQYPVYLSLMKTYLKLNQVNNFIKTLQNCRLFISQMFKQHSLFLDFQFVRITIALATSQNPKKGLAIIEKFTQNIKNNLSISETFKQKYLSKLIWDKCTILFAINQLLQAYQSCENQLFELQKTEGCSQTYWIEGVLCLAKSWCELKEVNLKNGSDLQKRLERAIQLSLSRQNLDLAFMLMEMGDKILQKCKDFHLPRILQALPSFEQAKIQFNAIREQLLQLIIQTQ